MRCFSCGRELVGEAGAIAHCECGASGLVMSPEVLARRTVATIAAKDRIWAELRRRGHVTGERPRGFQPALRGEK